MKRYLLLIMLLIAGDKAWGQIRIHGNSYYKFTISGHRKKKQEGPLGFRYRYELTELKITYKDGSTEDLLGGATLISDLSGYEEEKTRPSRLPSGFWGNIDGRPADLPADPMWAIRVKECPDFDIRKKISKINFSYYDFNHSPYSGGKTYKHKWNSSDNIKPDKQRESNSLDNIIKLSNEEDFIGNIGCFGVFDFFINGFMKDTKIRVFPMYNIEFEAREYKLASNQNLTITLPDNLESDDYVWKYRIGGEAEILFPEKYNYKHALDIISKEFVNEKDFGKRIAVWVESPCKTDGPKYFSDPFEYRRCSRYKPTYKSNEFTFIVYPAGPQIVSVTPSNPKCADGTGSVTLTFDRMLLKEEEKVTFFYDGLSLEQKMNDALVQQLRKGTTVLYNNLESGKHTIKMSGTYKERPILFDSAEFTITPSPTPVTFTTAKQNVYCAGGRDGYIKITASGGTPPYQYTVDAGATWQDFNDKSGRTALISNLAAGAYKIKVRDANLCVAKEKGTEKEASVKIDQPDAPIVLSVPEIREPKGYGLADGYIAVTVTDGTPDAGGVYRYEWRKGSPSGALLSDVTAGASDGFALRLNNVSAGNYYLTVKDRNYDAAASAQEACGIIAREITVSQPDPLIAEIQITKNISCNSANDYNGKNDRNVNDFPDEAEDGILTAIVRGGVRGYTYQWQQETKGIFQNIADAADSLAPNLTQGKYKVLITDANGITTTAEGQLNFPPELTIRLNGKNLLCNNAPAGSASVAAAGGTGAYRYRWNTQDKTPEIAGLSAGGYFVLVTDNKGCSVSGKITLTQPEPLHIKDLSIRNPRTPGAANGSIYIQASGGTGTYRLNWSNGMSGETISALAQGLYTLSLSDDNGCRLSKQYLLADPDKIKVDLGSDLTLCLGDTKTFNVTIHDPEASYKWTDSKGTVISSEPVITLSEAGTYTVTVRNPSGNFSSDTVTIRTSRQVLRPEFLVTTHAYTDRSVTLVNTSTTQPEKTEWILPQDKDIQIVSQSDDYIELKFAQPGAYTVGLKGVQGSCEKTFFKEIAVEENRQGIAHAPQALSNIKDFIIAPNPNRGLYSVVIKLHNAAPVRLRIISMAGQEHHNPVSRAAAKEFNIPFSLNLPTGIYLVILESNGESLVKKMIVL